MPAFRYFRSIPVIAFAVALLAQVGSSPVLAHLVLTNPAARTNDDYLTSDPCGGIPTGESAATYTAGTDIEITVNVAITHNRNLRAAISFDDFVTRTQLAMIQIDGSGVYQMTVPLPAHTSGPAILQVSHQRYVSCADIDLLEGAAFSINAGLNDAWVSADAPFQGLFFTVFENLGLFFLSWFTFDAVAPDSGTTAEFGAADQRWVTGAGNYSGDTVTLNVELTSGGIFNAAEPAATQSPGYGTITIVFISCNEAILTYDFPSVGLSGQMTLTRVLPDNVPLCEALATP